MTLNYRPRTKMMLDKLYDQVATGYIQNDWAIDFIDDVRTKFNNGAELTAKQILKIEELFERY